MAAIYCAWVSACLPRKTGVPRKFMKLSYKLHDQQWCNRGTSQPMPARAGWVIVTSTEAQRERKGEAEHAAGSPRQRV